MTIVSRSLGSCLRHLSGSVLLAAAALALSSLPAGAQQAADNMNLAPTPVIGAKAELKSWSDPIESLGTLQANESVVLSATVTDTISALNFDGGEQVKQGDVLIKLSDDEEQADLRSAQALRAERQNAVNRFAQLQARNMTARADLEDSRAQLQQVEANIQSLQARLTNYTVRAPFDGVVGIRRISVGTLVTPGTELVTLDDVSRMKLDFEVPAVYLGALAKGLKLHATTHAYPEQVFEGEIATIDSRIDPVSRSIGVRAILDNSEGLLRPGMLMRVTISRAPRQALVIPETALVPQGRRNWVWVITSSESGEVEQRQVQIGARQAGEVEITAGLEAGDLVVSHGTDRLHQASRISLLDIDDGTTSISDILRTQRDGDDA